MASGCGRHQFISHSTLLHHSDNGYLKMMLSISESVISIIQNDAITKPMPYMPIFVFSLVCVYYTLVNSFWQNHDY